MSWLDFVENPQPIRSTYGEEVPDVSRVELLGVTLDRSVRRALLTIATKSFPSDPPEKWRGGSTGAVTLSFSQVASILIDGWTDTTHGTFELNKSGSGVTARFTNDDHTVAVASEFARIDHVSAYIKD